MNPICMSVHVLQITYWCTSNYSLYKQNLTASNVEISETRKAKISGFRLAIEVPSRCGTRARLPIKCTTPAEALRKEVSFSAMIIAGGNFDNLTLHSSQKFSNKSDVWSFGILLWDIYSYGNISYPQMVILA